MTRAMNPRPVTILPCSRCGQKHVTRHGTQSCIGHARSGNPCKADRIVGLTVCRMHGANRDAMQKSQRYRENQIAEQAVRAMGLPTDVSPTEALLEEVRWTSGHVRWLRSKIQEIEDLYEQEGPASPAKSLEEHPLVWGKTKVVDRSGGQNPGTDETREARPSVWYDLYTRERDHLVKVASAALRAGVEERKVQMAERQGDLVATVIRRILDNLMLTREQQEIVAVVVPQQLRALAATPHEGAS